MQLPDRGELARDQFVGRQRKGHRFDDRRLIDLLAGRRVVEDVHVGVLVPIRHVLSVHARRKAHEQNIGVDDALPRPEDRDVFQTERNGRNRLQPGVTNVRCQVRQRIDLGLRDSDQRDRREGSEEDHEAGLNSPPPPQVPAQPAEHGQAGTGPEKDEGPRLRCGRGVPGIDVAQDHAAIEEELGIQTELMKATVVEAAEGEDGIDLLVGPETATQRVEQGERNVIRPGADVIRVIQGAREDVAEDAAQWIVDLKAIGPNWRERRPRGILIIVGPSRGAHDVRVQQSNQVRGSERCARRVPDGDADGAQIVGVEAIGNRNAEALADEVRERTAAQVVRTNDDVLLERRGSVDRRIDGRRPQEQGELVDIDGQGPGGGWLHDEHQRKAEPDEKSRPQAHTRRSDPPKHMAAPLLNGLVLLGGKPFATLVPSPKGMEDRVFFHSGCHRRNLWRQ